MVRHLQNGFLVIGQLPALTEAHSDKPWNLSMWDEERLRSQRSTTNHQVLRALRETENAQKVMDSTMEAASLGRMMTPRLLQEEDLHQYSFCRRIDVAEFREYEVDKAS